MIFSFLFYAHTDISLPQTLSHPVRWLIPPSLKSLPVPRPPNVVPKGELLILLLLVLLLLLAVEDGEDNNDRLPERTDPAEELVLAEALFAADCSNDDAETTLERLVDGFKSKKLLWPTKSKPADPGAETLPTAPARFTPEDDILQEGLIKSSRKVSGDETNARDELVTLPKAPKLRPEISSFCVVADVVEAAGLPGPLKLAGWACCINVG